VLYRAAHKLFEDLVLAEACGEREETIATLCDVPLLILDDVGMRKPPISAAEDLLEIVMRRYERASTIITSNRPIEDWPKLFGDTPAVTAFLDRLMHHCNLIEIRGKSYRLHESSVNSPNKQDARDAPLKFVRNGISKTSARLVSRFFVRTHVLAEMAACSENPDRAGQRTRGTAKTFSERVVVVCENDRSYPTTTRVLGLRSCRKQLSGHDCSNGRSLMRQNPPCGILVDC
jgi:hypothetical protein